MTLLHRSIDKLAPKEPILHSGMEVGIESVTLPLVAPFAAVISVLGNALERIVNLGSVSQADGTYTMGVWPPVSTRQDMGHTIRGGPVHKIKACTALLDVHRKLLYSTK